MEKEEDTGNTSLGSNGIDEQILIDNLVVEKRKRVVFVPIADPLVPQISSFEISSFFLLSISKRKELLAFSHEELYSFYSRHFNSLPRKSLKASDQKVPFVLKMSVLALFPIIESIPKNNCLKDTLLHTLVQLLENFPLFSLASEPADCLDCFQVMILI